MLGTENSASFKLRPRWVLYPLREDGTTATSRDTRSRPEDPAGPTVLTGGTATSGRVDIWPSVLSGSCQMKIFKYSPPNNVGTTAPAKSSGQYTIFTPVDRRATFGHCACCLRHQAWNPRMGELMSSSTSALRCCQMAVQRQTRPVLTLRSNMPTGASSWGFSRDTRCPSSPPISSNTPSS